MTSDFSPTVPQNQPTVDSMLVQPVHGAIADPGSQVCFQTEAGQLLLQLPPETENGVNHSALGWPDLWQQLQQRLSAGKRFWQPHTGVCLVAWDRLLDARQLQMIASALSEVQLQLKRIYTSRRQTAVTAAIAGYSVEQELPISTFSQSTAPIPVLNAPLYLQTTVRSGIDICHSGTVIILGDLNPGGTVVADGDVLVWGRLRGVAHAGARGNIQCRIMALQMEPTQLRIADQVARAPGAPPTRFDPEVAYVTAEGIRIARAVDFPRTDFSANS
jgi:septum site-determining protein MinC